MKHTSPQLGFNNNVRHKGRVFHIQTEDSGVKHPHIITHLFADGGRIIDSTKTSYAEHLDNENLPKKVRSLMQDQHKAMFIALRGGKFDQKVETVPLDPAAAEALAAAEAKKAAAGAATAAAAAPSNDAREAPVSAATAATEPRLSELAPSSSERQPSLVSANEFARAASVPAAPAPEPASVPKPVVAAPAAPEWTRKSALSALRPPSIPPPSDSRSKLTPPPLRIPDSRPSGLPAGATAFRSMLGRPSATDLVPKRSNPLSDTGAHEALRVPPGPGSKPGEPRPTLKRPSSHRPPMNSGLDLDLDTLAAASEQANTPVYKQVRDLPPPPAAVFKGNLPESTGYRNLVTEPKSRNSSPPAAPPPNTAQDRREEPSASGRYAPSRPAAIFGQGRPPEGSSIFGEDLISEKSLDEVILSYLAEDLESGPGSK